MRKFLFVLFLAVLGQADMFAQKMSVSTNLVDWAYLGTANVETDIALARHVTLNAGVKYNPWQFQAEDPDYLVENQQLAMYAGVKIWPWVVFDGVWFSVRGQYKDFAQTGIWRHRFDTGQEYAGVLSVGYTWMLTRHLNIEIATGCKAAYLTSYRLFCCPDHMRLVDSGPRMRYGLDNVCLSFAYVF